MEIVFHGHRANASDRMRKRAEIATRRVAARLAGVVDAVIRFEQDGPVKRVEIVLHATRQRKLVARGEARFYGTALASAIGRLAVQIGKLRARRRIVARASALRKAHLT